MGAGLTSRSRSAARRLREVAREQPELVWLAVLLALGLALRIYLTAVYRPGLVNYSDSGIYFQGALQSVWADPIRTAGYPIFLHVLHWVTPHLSFAIAVQHLFGLATAALLFFTVRRIGGPPWLGLIPAAIVAIGGDQLLIEHAALSEGLYTFLIAAALYCAVRAPGEGLVWAAAAGVLLGLSVWARAAGLALLPVIPLWLLLTKWRPTRRTAELAAVSLVSTVAAIGVYLAWRDLASDPGGLSPNGNWNLYGRVAPWADCTKFDPPSGTEGLCESTPPDHRDWGAEKYIYWPESPAQKLFGPPYVISSDPEAMDKLRRWSLAAIEGQPGDYLDAVWRDVLRLVDPNRPSFGAQSADGLYDFLIGGADGSGTNAYVASWQTLLYPGESEHHGDLGTIRDWEQLTRPVGVWMLLLLAFTVAAIWSVPRGPRSGARLLAAVSLVLLLFPQFTKGYDFRFVIPALGPLFAAAALGGWGLIGGLRGPSAR